jgi:hypothetical protein
MDQTSFATIAARQFLAAPLTGALAGFLVNRAHRGDPGWPMMLEMAAGSALFTLGAVLVSQFNAASERTRRQAVRRHTARIEAEFMRVEQARYEAERARYETVLATVREEEGVRAELARSHTNTRRLASALANVMAHVEKRQTGRLPVRQAEAQDRIAALEAAQSELARRQVELDQKTVREADELKTRLLQLSISDTQRLRNVAAPEAEHSGRLIELETRIRKLAGEIERLSNRQPAVMEAGEASKVGTAGTGDGARLGFLQAMLEANQTLRKRIQNAA